MKKNHIISSLSVALSVCCIAGAVEITRSVASGSIDKPVLNASELNYPDERILWNLFHAKKYKKLTAQIDQLRENFPGWRPPNDLLIALLDQQRSGKPAAQAVHARTSSTAVKRVYSTRKKIMKVRNPCFNLQARWNWADYHLKRNRIAKALDIYKHVIVQCPAKNKMETLEKVQDKLAYHDFNELLALSHDYLPSFYLDRLKYDAIKDQYVTIKQVITPEENEAVVNEARFFVDLLKDADFATAIAWRYFDLKDFTNSRRWFEKVTTWNPGNENARYGQLLCLEKEAALAGRPLADAQLAASAASKNLSPNEQAVVKRIYKAKAWNSFENKNLTQAEKLAAAATKVSGPDPEIQELNAWIAKENDQNERAAQLFSDLYEQNLSRKYARAYVESQAKVDRNELARKAKQKNGVLLEEYNRYQSKDLFERKQFDSSYKTLPNAYPNLENINSPSLDMGAYIRYKSGEDGLGRLDIFKAPVATGSYSIDGNQNFQLNLSRVQLYSGSPTKCVSQVGILPFNLLDIANNPGGTYTKQLLLGIAENPKITQGAKESILNIVDNLDKYQNGQLTPEATRAIQNAAQAVQNECTNLSASIPFSPTQQLNNAVEINFSYRKDGWFSPFVRLGSTPIDGVIDPMVTFDVGFLQQAGYGNWGLEAYSQPVRQSILSYTGIKDPYIGQGFPGLQSNTAVKVISNVLGASITDIAQGLEWGRVLRTGFRPSIFYRFNDNWNATGSLDLALLEGKNVEQNTTVAASLSVARNIHIPGFDYFNVGPSISYEHFNKNLSHFTYGHGGYFSPEHYFTIGAGMNFLTEEGKPYILKGSLFAGIQGIHNARAPYFPLGNHDAGYYPGTPTNDNESNIECLKATGSLCDLNKTLIGEAYNIELKGAWLVSPHFQIGAGAAIRQTNGFEDYTGGLFFRYYFDGRKGSFSTDLPAGMFSSMY